MKNGAQASQEVGAGRSSWEYTQEHLARVGSLGRGVRGPHVQVRKLRFHTDRRELPKATNPHLVR